MMIDKKPISPSDKIKEFRFSILFGSILFLFGAIFLNILGQDAIFNNSFFQFFADSNTYHLFYEEGAKDLASLINVQNNLLGPMIILWLANGNVFLVLFINITIFMVSVALFSRSFSIDQGKSAMFLILSPMMLSSLLSVNKEIISFLVISFIIYALRFNKGKYFLLALIFSILVRWQMTAFCITLGVVYLFRGYNRIYIILILMLSISVIFYFSQNILSPVLDRVEFYNLQYAEGSGLFERLDKLQNEGLYFLIAPAKAAHLLFSMGTKIKEIINPYNFYNDTVQGLHSLSNIILFILLFFKKRVNINNDFIFISIIYCLVFCLTPVYAPRYLFPVSFLWIFALIVDKSETNSLFNGVGGRKIVPPVRFNSAV